MFRTGLVHSSGLVFIGTYGPAPAIVWKFDLTNVTVKHVGWDKDEKDHLFVRGK